MTARSVAATDTLETFRTTFNSLSATDIGDLATLSSTIDATSIVGAINEIESEVSAFSVNTISNASDLGAAPATGDSFIIRDASANALREMTVANLFNTPSITSPTMTGIVTATGAVFAGASPLVFEGSSANSFETTFAITDPTADRTITFPNLTGTVSLITATETLTNKTLTTPIIAEIDSGSSITLDATTDIILDADGDNITMKAGGTTSLDFVLDAATSVTLDAPGDISLDADGGDVFLKDAGTTFGSLTNTSGNLIIKSGTTTALTMSGANVTVAGNLTVSGTTTTVDSTTINIQNSFVFEGATDDSFETTLTTVDPTADRTISLPNATDTLVGKATTDTLTNKTLTSPVVSGLYLSDSSIQFEGSSANNFETTLTVTNPTADRTITLPNETFLLSSGINKKTLDGDGSTTTVTIDAGYNVNQMYVTINGVDQEPTEDFTISGTTLTLDAAPASGDRVVVRY